MEKRIVSLLLALVMAVGLTLPAYAEGVPATGGSVSYKDWNGSELVDATKNASEYTVVADSEVAVIWGAENTTTCYVVNTDVTISDKVTAYGDVHLILCDGATLTVNGGVVVDDTTPTGGDNSNLTIYGQSRQTGKLVANGGVNVGFSAGIKIDSYGALTINGGIIEATGGDDSEEQTVTASYGIHGSYVIINSGKLTAKGGTAVPYSEEYNETYSGGISVWEMTVNGGEVIAEGGTATGTSGESFGIYSELYVGMNEEEEPPVDPRMRTVRQADASSTVECTAEVTATGGTATTSIGIMLTYRSNNGVSDPLLWLKSGKVTATGANYGVLAIDRDEENEGAATTRVLEAPLVYVQKGTLIAEATATGGKALDLGASVSDTVPLQCPTAYQWRTVKTGVYSEFPDTAYSYNGTDTYVEITAIDSGGDETPQPPQPQPPQPNPPTNPDSSGGSGSTGGSTHRPSGGQSATVNSAKTFDAGIAAYVVMGGISTVTSAAWIRRRKK